MTFPNFTWYFRKAFFIEHLRRPLLFFSVFLGPKNSCWYFCPAKYITLKFLQIARNYDKFFHQNFIMKAYNLSSEFIWKRISQLSIDNCIIRLHSNWITHFLTLISVYTPKNVTKAFVPDVFRRYIKRSVPQNGFIWNIAIAETSPFLLYKLKEIDEA